MIKSDKKIFLIGSGGHARNLINTINENNQDIHGIISNKLEKNTKFYNIDVIGNDEDLFSYNCSEILLVNGIGFTPYSNARNEFSKKMRKEGYRFFTVIDKNAIVANNSKLMDGAQIMKGAIIQTNTQIGENAIINTGSIVDHDCNIASDCHLCPGVVCNGNVTINKRSFVGSGSTIINNITIGKDCFIAAGSIVYKDIIDNYKLTQKRVYI